MALWQRVKRFGRSVVVLAVSSLVLEQVFYSVAVPGYFRGMLVSPVFWGLFSGVCFYLLWRFEPEFVKEVFKEENFSLEQEKTQPHITSTDFFSPNYSRSYRELIYEDLA